MINVKYDENCAKKLGNMTSAEIILQRWGLLVACWQSFESSGRRLGVEHHLGMIGFLGKLSWSCLWVVLSIRGRFGINMFECFQTAVVTAH